jgi:hypothetical protein
VVLPIRFEYVSRDGVREGRTLDGVWKLRGSAELSCWVAGGLYEYEGARWNGVRGDLSVRLRPRRLPLKRVK